MALPVPQRLMRMSAGLAQAGSTSQAGGVRPNGASSGVSTQLNSPTWPLKIHSHSIDAATTGTIDGR